jgi:hypothetical protein
MAGRKPYVNATTGESWEVSADDPSVNPTTGKPWTKAEYDKWVYMGGGSWNAPWKWSDVGTATPGEHGEYTFGVSPEFAGTNGYGWQTGAPVTVYTRDWGENKAGDIVYTDREASPILDAYGEPTGEYNNQTAPGHWSPYGDYGLGSQYIGVMPVGANAQGQPNQFFVMTAMGGGQIFDNPDDAKAALDEYVGWREDAWNKEHPGSQPAAGGTSGPTQTGLFTVPGAGEQYFDETKGYYTKPTRAGKAWDQTANQPTNSEQYWNGQSGRFNGPTEAESLYGQYEPMFSDPNYLDDFYNRERDKADTALARRASSGGWGGSGTWVRASGNLGQDFADRALAARQGWMTTGMGAAGAADQSFNARRLAGGTLASSADQSILDKIRTGATVDQGELERILAGQTSAKTAQQLQEDRETGGIDRAIKIAEDMSQLAMQGFSSQQAEQFASSVMELQLQVQSGKLTADQAYAQAQESLQAMGIVMNATLTAFLNNKFNTTKK